MKNAAHASAEGVPGSGDPDGSPDRGTPSTCGGAARGIEGSGGRIAAMATVVDCADPVSLLPGMREARAAIARGDLVVMPTDTVYGIAADAFQPDAVQALLDAKGRGRTAPPPVLVP